MIVKISDLLFAFLFYVVTAQEKRCDVPADVVFVMDSSDSIKDNEWEQEKNFVSVLIDNLHVDRHAIHVGVIVYSTDIGMVIDLQPFKTKAQLQELLQQAVHINLGTDTAKAIAKLIELSDTQGRIEGDAKQIGVIITDGRSTDVSATINEAGRARNLFNIDMIALGVGNETFLEELNAIAGSESRLFQVQNFAQLKGVVKQLEDIICEIVPSTTSTAATSPTTTTTMLTTTSPFIPPFPCSRPADIVFLIDGSYSISAPDWIKGKQFVSYLINSIDIGVDSVHVGLVVYGSDIGNVVSLSPFKNKADLKAAASALVQPEFGKTNTSLGIKTAHEMFSSQGRQRVPSILIVITDGKSSNPSETKYEAGLAKQRGITIFVVGVGNQVVKEEMEDMATSRQTMFDAPDFKYLVGMVEVLRDNICTAIQENTTLSTSMATTTPATDTTHPTIPAICEQCLVEGGVGFNPMPSDCEKYVLCLPAGLTYTPMVKSCPFGMFWSHDAVACMDARYVQCPSDRCKSSSTLQTYPSTADTATCRSYMRCLDGRSNPACCETGHRYKEGTGCVPDPPCKDACPLDITIYNQGACQLRPDHQSFYSYMEIIPGQGNVRRNCKPGQVYSHKLCACTYDVGLVVPQMECLPSVNLTFDGTFDDKTNNHQHIEVKGVGLSNTGTAIFNNDSWIALPNTANKNYDDKLLIRLKYRLHRKLQSGEIPTANFWGFENWLNNGSSTRNFTEILKGHLNRNISDSSHIPGSESNPVETITIVRNGSIIRDPNYIVTAANFSWPNSSQLSGHIMQLGELANTSGALLRNGVLYVPNNKGKLLIQEAKTGNKDSLVSKWTVLNINADGSTGTIEETGEGKVPQSIQDKYGFNLLPPIVQRWAVLGTEGVVLQRAEGVIPQGVLSRYEGMAAGTLVKLFEQGDLITKWEISKPDGSELKQGSGNIPKHLVDSLKLSSLLTPKQTASVWSVINSNGDVVDSGKGTIVPATIMQKYATSPSTVVFQSTSKNGGSPVWGISRTNGDQLFQGLGPLSPGIAQFIQGDVNIPQISSINGWKIQMPNGDIKSGTGPIPQDIIDLIMKQAHGTNIKIDRQQALGDSQKNSFINQGTQLNQRWELTMPNGSVQSGSGPLPSDLLAALTSQGSHVQWAKASTGNGNLRTRRAIQSARAMNLLSNCGSSIQIVTSEDDISMTLTTSAFPSGVTVTLPIHDNMNDVWMKYDGKHLYGIVNGFVMKKPASGNILTSSSPITIGQCPGTKTNSFIGEIDLLEIYHCLP